MDIEYYRRQIDRIDAQILQLLNQRYRCVLEIGKLKKHSGHAVYDSERESKVIANLLEINRGPLPQSYLEDIFNRIMSISKIMMQEK